MFPSWWLSINSKYSLKQSMTIDGQLWPLHWQRKIWMYCYYLYQGLCTDSFITLIKVDTLKVGNLVKVLVNHINVNVKISYWSCVYGSMCIMLELWSPMSAELRQLPLRRWQWMLLSGAWFLSLVLTNAYLCTLLTNQAIFKVIAKSNSKRHHQCVNKKSLFE